MRKKSSEKNFIRFKKLLDFLKKFCYNIYVTVKSYKTSKRKSVRLKKWSIGNTISFTVACGRYKNK